MRSSSALPLGDEDATAVGGPSRARSPASSVSERDPGWIRGVWATLDAAEEDDGDEATECGVAWSSLPVDDDEEDPTSLLRHWTGVRDVRGANTDAFWTAPDEADDDELTSPGGAHLALGLDAARVLHLPWVTDEVEADTSPGAPLRSAVPAPAGAVNLEAATAPGAPLRSAVPAPHQEPTDDAPTAVAPRTRRCLPEVPAEIAPPAWPEELTNPRVMASAEPAVDAAPPPALSPVAPSAPSVPARRRWAAWLGLPLVALAMVAGLGPRSEMGAAPGPPDIAPDDITWGDATALATAEPVLRVAWRVPASAADVEAAPALAARAPALVSRAPEPEPRVASTPGDTWFGRLQGEAAPAPTVAEAKAEAPAQVGVLVVNSRPWSHVTVDGQPAGRTFLREEVSAGAHTAVLTTLDGRTHEFELQVTSDGRSTYCWDFEGNTRC